MHLRLCLYIREQVTLLLKFSFFMWKTEIRISTSLGWCEDRCDYVCKSSVCGAGSPGREELQLTIFNQPIFQKRFLMCDKELTFCQDSRTFLSSFCFTFYPLFQLKLKPCHFSQSRSVRTPWLGLSEKSCSSEHLFILHGRGSLSTCGPSSSLLTLEIRS